VDAGYRRISVASACLGLVGTAGGAALGVPSAGLVAGLVLAAVTTVVLAAVIPAVLITFGG
jgi:hypothetical protein